MAAAAAAVVDSGTDRDHFWKSSTAPKEGLCEQKVVDIGLEVVENKSTDVEEYLATDAEEYHGRLLDPGPQEEHLEITGAFPWRGS